MGYDTRMTDEFSIDHILRLCASSQQSLLVIIIQVGCKKNIYIYLAKDIDTFPHVHSVTCLAPIGPSYWGQSLGGNTEKKSCICLDIEF